MRSLTDPRTYRPGPGEIPELPGVYRFSDPNGRVLYVGKAKNLRARLSNYFAPLDSLAERTRLMVTTATKVEWTVVATEYEALQLEFTWINEFEPPFNVQFRDDKSYPYLVVTLAEEAPRAIISRRTGIKGAKYFGPYPKVWAVKDTLELLYKVFPTRTCSDASYRKAMQTGKPCFPGQIGRCSGPCSGKVTIEEHREIVQQMVRFLSGRSKKLEVGLRRDMLAASADFDYERAAKLRDSLAAIQAVMAKSAVVLDDSTDTDVFGLAQDELSASIHQFLVRDGRIRGERSWVVTKEIDVETPELIEQLLETAYTIPESVVPARVLVPELPVDAELVTEWLSTMRKAGGKRGGVTVATAQRGTKAALMDTATLNARNSLALFKTRRAADYVTRTTALEGIAEALGMRDAPLRIECFDVSHLSGTNIVASMVVFEDGLPRKNQYRRFSIENSADDTESIHQVITRRLARLEEAGPSAQLEDLVHEDSAQEEDAPPTKEKFAYRPGLIIVDGGQPQVAAAARAMRESGVTDIALAGLAKRLEEVWLPDSDYPVILSRGSDALFMLQRLRDEAHRFAITFQRAKRKRDIRSELAEIPGLGAKRVSALLKHFGSVAALRGSDVAQVSAVPGIGTALAEIIVSTVNPERASD